MVAPVYEFDLGDFYSLSGGGSSVSFTQWIWFTSLGNIIFWFSDFKEMNVGRVHPFGLGQFSRDDFHGFSVTMYDW